LTILKDQAEFKSASRDVSARIYGSQPSYDRCRREFMHGFGIALKRQAVNHNFDSHWISAKRDGFRETG